MKRRTAAALRLLDKAHWFKHLGESHDGVARVVFSWEEALRLCFSPTYEWDNLRNTADNQYCACLAGKGGFSKWNDTVRSLEPAVRELVHRKVEGVIGIVTTSLDQLLTVKQIDKKIKPSEEFERVAVYGDVLLACMELEYADVHPPGFFANLMYWYVEGHFPCGWDGPQKLERWDFKLDRIVSRGEYPNLYPPGYYDPIAHWYEKGFGDWQGIPAGGKLIVY